MPFDCVLCALVNALEETLTENIFIYILSTPRNISRCSTIHNANISWRCNAQCAHCAVHRLIVALKRSSHSALMESVKRNGFCGIFLQLHKRPTMLLQNIGISFLSGNVEELFFENELSAKKLASGLCLSMK